MTASGLGTASLTQRIENAVKQKFADEDVSRVLRCWRNFAENKRHQQYLDEEQRVLQIADCYIDNLQAESFHDTSKYKWVDGLEKHYRSILDELQCYENNRKTISSDAMGQWLGPRDEEGSSYGPEWKTLGLQDRSVWNDDLLPSFPKTISILEEQDVPSCEVFFARQAPQSGIKPHSDRNNFILTCHLALDVPEGQCWIQVGSETYYWRNGKACIFDTSIVHHTQNESVDRTRYVLLIRFWHPQLTLIERQALQFIFSFLDHIALGDEAVEDFERRHLFLGKDNHRGLRTSTHGNTRNRTKPESRLSKMEKKSKDSFLKSDRSSEAKGFGRRK